MSEKLTFTLTEIAQTIGISEKTVRRKMAPIKELLTNGHRKRYYSPTERDLIISLFHQDIGLV